MFNQRSLSIEDKIKGAIKVLDEKTEEALIPRLKDTLNKFGREEGRDALSCKLTLPSSRDLLRQLSDDTDLISKMPVHAFGVKITLLEEIIVERMIRSAFKQFADAVSYSFSEFHMIADATGMDHDEKRVMNQQDINKKDLMTHIKDIEAEVLLLNARLENGELTNSDSVIAEVFRLCGAIEIIAANLAKEPHTIHGLLRLDDEVSNL